MCKLVCSFPTATHIQIKKKTIPNQTKRYLQVTIAFINFRSQDLEYEWKILVTAYIMQRT